MLVAADTLPVAHRRVGPPAPERRPGQRPARRPKPSDRLAVERDWQGLTAGAQLQAQGARFDDHANTKPLGGYALLNLNLGYRINAQTRLQLNLDNALDKDYETAKGFAQAGRTLQVGVRLSL